MTTLTMVTPWCGGPSLLDGGYRAAIQDFFAVSSIAYIGDQPGQTPIPDPNMLVVRVTSTDDVAAAIAADPVWGPRILMEE